MPGRSICFVCGNPGVETSIFIRQQDRNPYFPFLEHHDPPKGARLPTKEGCVDSCRVCYAFLTSQWETYERTKTPAIKRLYWLKRSDNGAFTGAEMRLQGEYIAQVMGLQYQPGGFEDGGSPDGSNFAPEPEYSSRTSHQSEIRIPQYSYSNTNLVSEKTPYVPVSNTTPSRPKNVPLDSALDLSTSKKEASRSGNLQDSDGSKSQSKSFVCYVCGQSHAHETGKNINVFKASTGEPYFPVLEKITPAPGAEYMSRNGQVRVCGSCRNTMYQQWQAYEMSGTPIHLRTYKISDDVQPHSQREKNHHSVKREEKKETISATTFICYICGVSNITDHAHALNTIPTKSTSSAMFFPFVRELKRPSGAEPLRSDGSVTACLKCYGHLSYQWQIQEVEGVPVYHRQYSLGFLTKAPESHSSTGSRSKTPTGSEIIQPLNIQISTTSPVPPSQNSNSSNFQTTQGLLAIAPPVEPPAVSLPPKRRPYSPPPLSSKDTSYESVASVGTESKHNSGSVSKTAPTVPHPLQQVSLIPRKICFLCGEKCLVNKMRHLSSYPARHDAKVANVQVDPFFPFLANREPAPGADSVTEDGTVATCKLCYYSMVKQWEEYELSKNTQDSNRWLRKYTLPDYQCYVCGSTSERKFVRSLSTKKFQFLKDHKVGPNTLVLDNGDKVVVCKACAYNLMRQYAEYERMGVPSEFRKFNWMHKSAATYDSADDAESLDEARFEEKFKPDSSSEEKGGQEAGNQLTDTQSGSAQGSKPAPLNMLSPAGSKLQRNTATVSPLHHGSSPTNGVTSIGANSALNSSRTASFSAALRKLANQAKDPPDEPALKSSTSTSPRETPSKRGPPPLVYSTATTLTSPPVVTIAPTPSHSGLHSSDARQGMDRLHSSHSSSSLFEPVVKSDRDRPHSSLSRDDDRVSGRDNLSQSARRLTPHSTPGPGTPMSSKEEGDARGFQPYRPGDDMRHSIPTSMSLDPATAMAAAAAYSSYPAFLPPHAFPHPAFRFDDPLMLERYRMMHPPYMPYGPASMMPHPGLHPLLAAGGRYPADLLPPQMGYPSHSQSGRLPEHRSPSLLSERQRLEEEKQRELEREKEREREREKERELALQRERQRALERENERQRERILSREREQERRESLEKPRAEHPLRDKGDDSLSAKFGSIIQGTPKGLGIADRYPRVPSSQSSMRREEHRGSKDEPPSYPGLGNYSRESSHSSHKVKVLSDEKKYKEHEKRYSLVNPVSDAERSRPPPLISPKSRDDLSSRTHKSSESSLFRPFASKHLVNGIDSSYSRESDKLFHHRRDSGDRKVNHDHSTVDTKHKSSFTKDSKDRSHSSHSFNSSSSAFRSLDNRVSSAMVLPKQSQDPPSKNHSTPQSIESLPLTTLHSSSAPTLNVPAFSSTATTNSAAGEAARCVVSKLDMEEKKLCESRTADSYCSDSECEEEWEEDAPGRGLLIASGPPLCLETPPPKMALFKQLGLTTQKHRKDKEFERQRKRRRKMRECSLSPVQLEEEPPELPTLRTDIRPEDLCREPDYKSKCQFFAQFFCLEPVAPEKRRLFEQFDRVCDGVKQRRQQGAETTENRSESCTTPGTGVKRKLEEEEEDSKPKSVTSHNDESTQKTQFPGPAHQSGSRSKGSPGAGDRLMKPKPMQHSTMLYPYKQQQQQQQKLGRDFVQEFHDSVLQTTRQKELAQRLGQSTADSLDTVSRSDSAASHKSSDSLYRSLDRPLTAPYSRDKGHRHHSSQAPSSSHLLPLQVPSPSGRSGPAPGGSDSRMFGASAGYGFVGLDGWPGIGGIMESYHRHMLEERLERQILMDRMRRLQSQHSELSRTAEEMSQKMEDVMKVKRQQEEGRYRTQARIDSLKTVMKKLR